MRIRSADIAKHRRIRGPIRKSMSLQAVREAVASDEGAIIGEHVGRRMMAATATVATSAPAKRAVLCRSGSSVTRITRRYRMILWPANHAITLECRPNWFGDSTKSSSDGGSRQRG